MRAQACARCAGRATARRQGHRRHTGRRRRRRQCGHRGRRRADPGAADLAPRPPPSRRSRARRTSPCSPSPMIRRRRSPASGRWGSRPASRCGAWSPPRRHRTSRRSLPCCPKRISATRWVTALNQATATSGLAPPTVRFYRPRHAGDQCRDTGPVGLCPPTRADRCADARGARARHARGHGGRRRIWRRPGSRRRASTRCCWPTPARRWPRSPRCCRTTMSIVRR